MFHNVTLMKVEDGFEKLIGLRTSEDLSKDTGYSSGKLFMIG